MKHRQRLTNVVSFEELDAALTRQRGLGRRARINFAVTREEQRDMEAVAKEFGLSVSEYFRRLHNLTAAMLRARRKEKK